MLISCKHALEVLGLGYVNVVLRTFKTDASLESNCCAANFG